MTEQRRLAAILAADVVGYSRLMGRDESGTVARLRELRKNYLEPALARHSGRLVKLMGDGALVEFPSAVGAVSAAIEFQQAVAEDGKGEAADDAILFRIGIHLGDLIVDGEDLYGDGVNVAARLEGEAPSGGILVSRTVHEAVEGRLKARFDDLGDLALKNIERPARTFRVTWDVADWPMPRATPPMAASAAIVPAAELLSLPDKPSIAVLPFTNMSGDPEQEYFTDGIVEDITTSLSKTRGFFVIARNSSFTYKGQAVDVTRVGRELGVRYVLEGSVRKAGDRVRITAQLIDTSTGSHLWAEKYDRHLSDLFTIQDELTREIVGTVAPQMLEAEMRRARQKSPQSLDAWDYAMRAQWHLARLTQEDNAEALRLGLKANELSPSSTAGLNIAAFAYIYCATFGWPTAGTHPIAGAYEVASKAVTLDARDEVAQTALASSELFMRRHDDSVARLHDAVHLNSNFTWAHGNLGLALILCGRSAEAIEPLKEAIRLSPRDQFNFLWLYLLAFAYWLLGQYGLALDHVDQSLRENPNNPGPHRLRAASLSRLGHIEQARASLAVFLRHVPTASRLSMRAQLPFKNDEDFERYADALGEVGLPE